MSHNIPTATPDTRESVRVALRRVWSAMEAVNKAAADAVADAAWDADTSTDNAENPSGPSVSERALIEAIEGVFTHPESSVDNLEDILSNSSRTSKLVQFWTLVTMGRRPSGRVSIATSSVWGRRLSAGSVDVPKTPDNATLDDAEVLDLLRLLAVTPSPAQLRAERLARFAGALNETRAASLLAASTLVDDERRAMIDAVLLHAVVEGALPAADLNRIALELIPALSVSRRERLLQTLGRLHPLTGRVVQPHATGINASLSPTRRPAIQR